MHRGSPDRGPAASLRLKANVRLHAPSQAGSHPQGSLTLSQAPGWPLREEKAATRWAPGWPLGRQAPSLLQRGSRGRRGKPSQAGLIYLPGWSR